MTIFEKQNTTESLRLIRAYRVAYNKARIYGGVRVWIAILTILAAPFILYLVPKSSVPLAIIGGFLTILSELPFERIENRFKVEGAKLQEQFDTQVFDLPWNEIRCKLPVPPEIANRYATEYKENPDAPITNWYSEIDGVPYPLDVLVCQRSNLVWDWRLRRNFATFLSISVSTWMLATVIYGFYRHQQMIDYFLGIFIPSLPALIQAIKAYNGHTENANEKKELSEELTLRFSRAIETGELVSVDQCRAIQDSIYCLRAEGPMVPNLLYVLLQKRYESDMGASAEQYRTTAQQRFRKDKE